MKARFNFFKTLKGQSRLKATLKEGLILLEKELSRPDFYVNLGEI